MSILVHNDRRKSPRIISKLIARAPGEDARELVGDISVGGVGFELPACPDAETFQVSFCCPGESELRSATAEVIATRPINPGLEEGYSVHLKFLDLSERDARALSASINTIISSAYRRAEAGA